jgi:hypothetical protein
VLCRRRLVVSRTIGRADDCEWVKAEMASGHKAPNHGLHCNRVDCNQRCESAEQPRHGTTPQLGLWSFAVAIAHGAGLMLVPIYLGLSVDQHRGPKPLQSFNLTPMSCSPSTV